MVFILLGWERKEFWPRKGLDGRFYLEMEGLIFLSLGGRNFSIYGRCSFLFSVLHCFQDQCFNVLLFRIHPFNSIQISPHGEILFLIVRFIMELLHLMTFVRYFGIPNEKQDAWLKNIFKNKRSHCKVGLSLSFISTTAFFFRCKKLSFVSE